MTVTIRNESQITLPSEILTKLGLHENNQLDVREENGAIVLIPTISHSTKYIENLKHEAIGIKGQIASGEQPVFNNVDALFESLEN